MTFHFEMTASGVRGMFTGKPCPPVRCQRSCAIHPAAIWNRPPVVSSFASLDKKPTSGAMYSSYTETYNVSTIEVDPDDIVESHLDSIGVAARPEERRSDHAQQQRAMSRP